MSEATGRPKSIAPDDMTVDVQDATLNPLDAQSPGHQQPAGNTSIESWRAWQAFLSAHRDHQIGEYDNVQTFVEPEPHALESSLLEHFTQRIKLCSLSHQIGAALYSAAAGRQQWSEFQKKLQNLDREVIEWRDKLPKSLQISPQNIAATKTNPRPQIELALYYQSLRMIQHRPCVCKIDIMHESTRSKDFNMWSARECLQAATSMLELLPEVGVDDAYKLFHLLPWWGALHYISQAASVLLLELTLKCEHLAEEGFEQDQEHLITSLQKAMDYLWLLAPTSKSAGKAWSIFRQLYEETMALYPGRIITWDESRKM